MPIQFPGARPIARPMDVANRDVNANQMQTNNALINDAQRMKNQGLKTEMDDTERLKVAREMKVMAGRGIEMMNRGVPVDSFRNDLADWFMQRGMDVSRIPEAGSDPREFMEGFENLGRSADDVIASLVPQMQDLSAEDTPHAQRGLDGEVNVVGFRERGPNSNMQDWAKLQEIGNEFGVDSDEYRQYAAMVVTPKYGSIAGVPSQYGTGGSSTPLSTQPAELDFTQREAQAKEQGSRAGQPTTAQEKIDAAYAPEYIAFTQGGYQDAIKGIEQLGAVQIELNDPNADLSGWAVASQPDILLSVTNPEALQAREQVEEVVQRNLRLILGAQFTEKEGVRLIARAYNPWMEEKYNAIRINRLVKSIREAANAKVAAAKHYEQHGTLKGFESKVNYSYSDFYDVLDDQTPLSVGDVYKGRTYLGGNPKERSSWE